MIAPSTPTCAHLDKFFAKIDPPRARLIFAIDATASRQPSWDVAARPTADMFDAAVMAEATE
jgi:hypothetical protein